MTQLGISAARFLAAFQAIEELIAEHNEKISSIYRLIKNAKWPLTKEFHTIGVVGDISIFYNLENSLSHRKFEDKKFIVKNIASISDVSECQMIYVATKKSQELDAIMDVTLNKNIWVVTENDL